MEIEIGKNEMQFRTNRKKQGELGGGGGEWKLRLERTKCSLEQTEKSRVNFEEEEEEGG